MVFEIFIEPPAEIDLHEISNWYNLQKEGLGATFIRECLKSLDLLSINPYLFRKRYKNIRALQIRKFPYNIFYFVNNLTVHIIAIIHHKRNPKIWKKRITLK